MALPSTIFIAGPTGSGKSSVAVELARIIDAEIVSADAYQVYREMPILTATPSWAERGGIPHHMLGILSVSENWDATAHYHRATDIIADIHRRGKTAIITGGSGLYLKFLSHGISEAPPGNAELRASFASRSIESLYAELQQLDPDGAAMTSPSNRRYVERNLEIVIVGGKPLSYWKNNWQQSPAGPGWVITRDVAELDARIARRASQMFEDGVVEEVRTLPSCSVTAERTLGLSLIRDYIRTEISLLDCRDKLALITRQYAKRQRTWQKRESWLTPLTATQSTTPQLLASQICASL